METIYQLPTWAETILVICVAIMLAGLGAFIFCKAAKEAIDAESKLEHNRAKNETKALNNWQKLYEEERQLRDDDNCKADCGDNRPSMQSQAYGTDHGESEGG